MKKEYRAVVFFIAILALTSVLLLNLVSATDIILGKAEYYPGETIQADIYGSFSGGLVKEKVLLCRGNEVNPIAVSSGLVQTSDKYLFYAFPSSTLSIGDYSLKIKSSTTPYSCLSGVILSTKPLKIIAPTDKPYIQVNPGFIISANNGEISFQVKNFNAFQKVDANFAATGEAKSLNIPEDGERNFYFSVNNLYGNVESSVKVNDYTIPVYLSLPPAPENPPNQTENNTTNQTTEQEIILTNEIKFSPETMSIIVLNNTDYEINFSIVNKGNKTIDNLAISSNSSEITLSKESISELFGYNSTIVSMNFKIAQPLNFNINLTYKNQSIYLPVSINVTKNNSEVDVETSLIEVSPVNFDKYINFSQKYRFNFTIENNGNKIIEDITLSCENENIKLDKTEISSIKPGKSTIIYFEVNTNETIESEIEIDYENETTILPLNFKEYREEEYNLSDNLIFYPEEMNGTFLLGKEYRIIIANIGENDLEDITISCDNTDLKFTPVKIDLLKSYKKTYINITITINSGEDINTSLIAKWENQEISLPINGIITNNELEEQIETEDSGQYPTCLQKNGVTCKKGEKCNGRLDTDILLSNCCYGKCEAESSSTKWIAGILLLIVLGIGGFYFYSKYKNSKSASSDERMKNREKDFQARMNPTEVRGSLSKV